MPPPNVLLIQVDQMHADALGGVRRWPVRTPHLDRLAAEGVHFTQAHAAAAVCTPSRVALLTGRRCSRTGVYLGNSRTPRGVPWLHRVLRSAGYRTGAFGKFHVKTMGPEAWDFDAAAPTLPEEADWARPPGCTYENDCRAHNIPWPHDQIHGHVPGQAERVWAPAATTEMGVTEREQCVSAVPAAHSLERWTADACLRFLEGHDPAAGPFFAWLSFDRPHHPLCLAPEFAPRIDQLMRAVPEDPLPPLELLLGRAPSVQHVMATDSCLVLGDATVRRFRATYLALIEIIDAEIGRVLESLRRRGWADDTLVVFTSDHGDMAGVDGLVRKPLGPRADALSRVPLIIRPPRGPAIRGRQIDATVSLLDLLPTIAACAGAVQPEGGDGVDLGPVLAGRAAPDPDRVVLCEAIHTRVVIHGRQRLCFHWRDDEECEFFDLALDPCGWRNRYRDPAAQRERVFLKRRLLGLLVETAFGAPTGADGEAWRAALDPELPPVHRFLGNFGDEGFSHFGAGGFVVAGRQALAVPYTLAEPLLRFDRATREATRRDALPTDAAAEEALLDVGLRDLLKQSRRTDPWDLDGPYPGQRTSRERLAELYRERASRGRS